MNLPSVHLHDHSPLMWADVLPVRSVNTLTGSATTFLQVPSGAIPTFDSPGIRGAIGHCRRYLEALQPEMVFLPWRFAPPLDIEPPGS